MKEMKELVSIVLVCLLGSCSIWISPHVNIVDSPYPREEVLMAVHDFEDAWDDHYDEDTSVYMDDMTVKFQGKSEKEWNTQGCYTGTTANQFRVNVSYVTDVEEWPIYKTAIWHEFTHMVLWNTVNDPDRDHETGDGPWTAEHNKMVGEIKTMWQQRLATEEEQEE